MTGNGASVKNVFPGNCRQLVSTVTALVAADPTWELELEGKFFWASGRSHVTI